VEFATHKCDIGAVFSERHAIEGADPLETPVTSATLPSSEKHCGKIIKADADFVVVGVKLNPPGLARVHAECHEEYQMKKKGKPSA
jgi:hypothetical protein